MKKTDGETVVTRWHARASAETAAIVAQLQEQAAEAVAAGQAALPRYAELAQQYGAHLRAEQLWLKDRVLEHSRWFLDVMAAREKVAGLLGLLADDPGRIQTYLREVAEMTPAYAMSYRLERVIMPALAGAANNAARFPELVAELDALLNGAVGVEGRVPRLLRETPALAPRPVLASAGSDGPPSGPRRATSGLSGAGDD